MELRKGYSHVKFEIDSRAKSNVDYFLFDTAGQTNTDDFNVNTSMFKYEFYSGFFPRNKQEEELMLRRLTFKFTCFDLHNDLKHVS